MDSNMCTFHFNFCCAGIPPEHFHLFYQNRMLTPGTALMGYGIQRSSTLIMQMGLMGGGRKRKSSAQVDAADRPQPTAAGAQPAAQKPGRRANKIAEQQALMGPPGGAEGVQQPDEGEAKEKKKAKHSTPPQAASPSPVAAPAPAATPLVPAVAPVPAIVPVVLAAAAPALAVIPPVAAPVQVYARTSEMNCQKMHPRPPPPPHHNKTNLIECRHTSQNNVLQCSEVVLFLACLQS